MVGLPAVCHSCGFRFQSNAISLGEGTSVTMTGSKVTCPRCHRMADFQDGTFKVQDGVLHALRGVDLNRERVETMAVVAKLLQEGAITQDVAASQLGEHAPGVAGVFNSLPVPLRRAFIFFLATVLQILAAQYVAEERDKSATPADVEQAVERALEKHGHENALPVTMPRREPARQPRRAEKVGRNDPCPCGSGRKHKRCCGR